MAEDKPIDRASVIDVLPGRREWSERLLIAIDALPGPDAPFDDHPDLGRLSRDFPPRVTMQAALWDKSFLRYGSSGRKCLGLPYSYTQSTSIVRGRWAHEVKSLNKRETLGIDPPRRPFEPALVAWLRKAPMLAQ